MRNELNNIMDKIMEFHKKDNITDEDKKEYFYLIQEFLKMSVDGEFLLDAYLERVFESDKK